MPTTDPYHITTVARAANATLLGEMTRLAYINADRFVAADLCALPVDHRSNGYTWRDTRPCLDEREHSPEVIDIWRDALRYADYRQLVERHPLHPHLVHVRIRAQS
ncbi:MAG: hypothetical protein IPM99_18960 [Rubrivivax sp.]|nr:hypothetical protein [Rubrivivax sp.]